MSVALPGARVLITGASGGLGAAIARAFAAQGATPVLSGRREEALRPLAEEVGGEVVVNDLAQPDAVEALLATAGHVDVAVLNAALPGSGRLDGYAVEEIDRVLEVNLRAPIVTARLLAPEMVDRGSGHLLFMSSLSGKSATMGQSLYNATKFGLRGFATALRADLHGSGVGVSTVFPGFIRDAGMFHESGVTLPRGVSTRSPQDVADACVRAVRDDRAEVDVAPLPLRAGTLLAQVAPELATRLARRLGGDDVARQFEDSQARRR